MINAALDATIIFLLLVAMLYGYRLNRRISVIQNSRKELSELFKVFDQTIVKAHASVEDLRHVCDDVSGQLQKKIDQAALMIDDLSFVAERSEKLMDSMEQAVRGAEAAKKQSLGIDTLPSDAKTKKAKAAQKQAKPANEAGVGGVNQKEKRQARQKALETLLTEISKKREERQTVEASAGEAPAKAVKGQQKQNDKIAHMLKALGYGQSK